MGGRETELLGDEDDEDGDIIPGESYEEGSGGARAEDGDEGAEPQERPRHQQRRNRAGRVRTVLSEKQLNVLKSCYSANPRPDALVKEQLVEMTGLSPRVVRVWFQNKRCKDKKKMAMREGKVSRTKNKMWIFFLNREKVNKLHRQHCTQPISCSL